MAHKLRKTQPVTTPPFTAENFLKAVEDASRRSRQLLLLLIITTMLILMAFFNALKEEFNWFTSRIELLQNALNFFELPYAAGEPTPHTDLAGMPSSPSSLGEFVRINEQEHFGLVTDTSIINAYNRTYPMYSAGLRLHHPRYAPVSGDAADRAKQYRQIGRSLDYLQSHFLYDRVSLQDYMNKMTEAKVEHINLVRVPILGISFDVNNLTFYSGGTLLLLYCLLYFALKRESINLKVAFRRGWINREHHHFYFYEYVSMHQVLGIPKKLFEPKKRNKHFYDVFALAALVGPTLVYLSLVGYDWYSRSRGLESNPTLTMITLGFSTFFALLMVGACGVVISKWKRMDHLWDNQAYEFNFEYILECLGLDKRLDLIDFGKRRLYAKDRSRVKHLWLLKVSAFLQNHQTPTTKQGMAFFNRFLSIALAADKRLPAPIPEKDKKYADRCWKKLLRWFEHSGRQNVGDSFRTSFVDMLLEIKALETNPRPRAKA